MRYATGLVFGRYTRAYHRGAEHKTATLSCAFIAMHLYFSYKTLNVACFCHGIAIFSLTKQPDTGKLSVDT